MRLEIGIYERGHGRLTAIIEDGEGNRLGEATAPIMDGATFDVRGAVIRAAVEQAIPHLGEVDG